MSFFLLLMKGLRLFYPKYRQIDLLPTSHDLCMHKQHEPSNECVEKTHEKDDNLAWHHRLRKYTPIIVEDLKHKN